MERIAKAARGESLPILPRLQNLLRVLLCAFTLRHAIDQTKKLNSIGSAAFGKA